MSAIETAELLAFVKVVDAGSLARAAAELAVPRATVSRRLARLERRLGVRLLRRTTRNLAITEAGTAFYRHAHALLDALDSAEASVRADGHARGTLRVSLPPSLDPSFFAMICRFARDYPEVRLQLHFATEHVDLLRDGYDVALRASTELEPGLTARNLARIPLNAFASPRYLEKHGVPTAAGDLRRHRILMGFARGELPDTHWPLAKGGRIAVEGSLFSNDLQLLCDAAVRGLGIALLPQLIAARPLADGRLRPVLPSIVAGETRVALLHRDRELTPPALRAFIDAVAEWAKDAFKA